MFFNLNGTIADVDGTTTADVLHPALVLVVNVGGELHQVVLPNALLKGDMARFQIGARIRISGSSADGLSVGERTLVASAVSVEPKDG